MHPRPIPLEQIGETVIKKGYKGFAAAVNLSRADGADFPIVIFARTKEEAAAVCEFLGDVEMNLAFVHPAVLGAAA